jgi:hypothetical protein
MIAPNLNSITRQLNRQCAHLSTSKGLALYLGRFFLQPLSHIDMVQLDHLNIFVRKTFFEIMDLSQGL